MPTVAVIIPAYNPDETWLRSALESVVRQTFVDWEAVVVDDGSTSPLTWCGALDERISVVRQANLGLPEARNRGLRETTAPLVAFLDADDEWFAAKLDRQVRVLEEDVDRVMCSTDFEHIDASGTRIGPGYTGHNKTYVDLLTGCGIVPSTVMVRRSALNRVGPFLPLASAEDWELWLRLAMLNDLTVIDEVLARYRPRHLHQAGAMGPGVSFDEFAFVLGHRGQSLSCLAGRRGSPQAEQRAGGDGGGSSARRERPYRCRKILPGPTSMKVWTGANRTAELRCLANPA